MDDKPKPIVCSWLRLVFSPKGIWCFYPGILGIFFVYWAEANVHVELEEVLENIAHLFLIFSGIVAFFFINRQYQKHSKFSKSSATKTQRHTKNEY